FFFQAEDGIRDFHVTGVQTCALPISDPAPGVELFAAKRRGRTMILAQLSDTHFGTEQPEVVEALVAWMQDHAPDLVIFSGDITQRARRNQFQAARRFIDRIPKHNLLTIPGNHDLPLFDLLRRTINPYGYYCEFF